MASLRSPLSPQVSDSLYLSGKATLPTSSFLFCSVPVCVFTEAWGSAMLTLTLLGPGVGGLLSLQTGLASEWLLAESTEASKALMEPAEACLGVRSDYHRKVTLGQASRGGGKCPDIRMVCEFGAEETAGIGGRD